MLNPQLFELLKQLELRYSEPPKYNLFNVLRSAHDEVRLHSRFLADLLNPEGRHQHGRRFLDLFLSNIEVTLSEIPKVLLEYRNIDILIRAGDIAVVVENKIYADDQPEQLLRYHEIMKDEGVKTIHLIYLTLDGRQPSEQSAGHLIDQVKCVSYRQDIHHIINKAISLAARDAPLREALIQYETLINLLTDRTDNMEHIAEVKSLLFKDDNLLSFPSLEQAYREINIDNQLAMWELIADRMKGEFGPLTEDSLSEQRRQGERVASYVDRKNNSRYIRQAVRVENAPEYTLYIEQDHHLYFGIRFEKESGTINRLSDIDVPYRKEGSEEELHIWDYPKKMINFRSITADDILYLSKSANREAMVNQMIAELVNIKSLLDKAHVVK
ncbi:PD-(D/E)XK nuclease family protein [Veronia pacifica]|uniref:PD-(D/E)XK nuclease superfamily protein n=1 Tax=Veronia pacifica TaxID=1080227 RepID=A0A1C3EC31_9GAMM|nr:PD-(D/E)XK nuclease family protein [Veronia pacifica]ODA30799.1 hypothetical protein A8L45_19305 [Veronia pacifica]